MVYITDLQFFSASQWTETLAVDIYSYYTFNSTSGNVVLDSMLNDTNDNRSGLIQNVINSSWNTNGLIGGNLFVDGQRDNPAFVNFTANFSIFRGTSGEAYTINFWVRNITLDGSNIIMSYNLNDTASPVEDLYIYINSAGIVKFAVGGGTEFGTIKITESSSTWDMITLVKNDTHATTYHNGVLNTSIAQDGNAFSSYTFKLFDDYNSYGGWGFFDEMGIWGRSLSASDVSNLYNSGAGLTPNEYLTSTYNFPTSNQEIYRPNATYFNITYSSDIVLVNSTLYIDGVKNTSRTISGNNNESIYTADIRGLSFGTHNSSTYACNLEPSCSSLSTITYTLVPIYEYAESFDLNSTEGNQEFFQLNVSLDPSETFDTVNLVYNSTSYAGSISKTGDVYTLSRTLTIPSVSADGTASFYWNLVTDSGVEYNSTINNQTIRNLNIDDCSSYSLLLLNLTLKDEDTQNVINGTIYNSTIEVDLNIYPLGSTSSLLNFSSNFSSNNNPQVCLQSELLNGTYRMDAQIRYDGDSYANEYYHIQNYSLTNSTLTQNINLFDLLDSKAQEFTITFKDSDFLPVENAIIQVQRKYINEGLYKSVEVPKTDENGETIANLVLNDVVYTFVVLKDGVVLGTFNNLRAVCQNPTIETCSIPLNTFGSSISPKDYTSGDDFTFAMTYDKDTRTISTTYAVPSGTSSLVSLNATLFDNLGKTQVCGDYLQSSSGTLECVIPNAFGNGTVSVTLLKDGTEVGKAFISLDQKPSELYGSNLIFIGIFLFLTLVGAGVQDNTMITGIFLIIGVILLVALNVVDTGLSSFVGGGATILYIIIAVILIMIKGARRQ